MYIQAFNKLKKRLVSAPLLAYFDLERPLMLKTNALDGVIASIFFLEVTGRRIAPCCILFKDYNKY